MPKRSLEDLHLSHPSLVIAAESVEKPGNLGAILRTADAARVDALLVCDPRVDLWNPNVIRASRGAVFAVPAVEVDSLKALEWLKSEGDAGSGGDALRRCAVHRRGHDRIHRHRRRRRGRRADRSLDAERRPAGENPDVRQGQFAERLRLCRACDFQSLEAAPQN
ncbi:MAG: hypothetical protein HND47_14420 [Chloroflexi bacterium]|nr:hypothetical protein [Chloroflexota bacterium]